MEYSNRLMELREQVDRKIRLESVLRTLTAGRMN
jgi:hypothetical protein